jgi:hypothetical protein
VVSNLASLIPKAVAWVIEQSDLIARTGLPLDDAQTAIARSVGVAHPEQIKVLEFDVIPTPNDAELMQAIQTSGLLPPNMAGLTMGHGIYIRHGQVTIRLLSHEFRHVYQYEHLSVSVSSADSDSRLPTGTAGN